MFIAKQPPHNIHVNNDNKFSVYKLLLTLNFFAVGPFFHSVWEALLSSGIGETLTYKELAGRSGKPKAARAVGTAVRSHHLPILVPCHRVVKTSGQHATSKRVPYEIGQYSGGEGPETKQWLLAHEQAMLKQKL